MEIRQPSTREQRVAERGDLPRQVGQGCGASNSIILGFLAESGGVVQMIGGIIESSPSAAQYPKPWAVGGGWPIGWGSSRVSRSSICFTSNADSLAVCSAEICSDLGDGYHPVCVTRSRGMTGLAIAHLGQSARLFRMRRFVLSS